MRPISRFIIAGMLGLFLITLPANGAGRGSASAGPCVFRFDIGDARFNPFAKASESAACGRRSACSSA